MASKVVLRRGDVVVSAFSGDYGKPRPAIVIQSDIFNEHHDSFVVAPTSSDLTGQDLFRVPLPASISTGLKQPSEVMIDKIVVSKRDRIHQRIGRLSAAQLRAIDTALRIWLDLPEDRI